jgi:hypothetical protein
MICKHYNSIQGCSYGEKCQFAHGPQELRLLNNNLNITNLNTNLNKNNSESKKSKQINPINIKTVKCKNWEKDGTCKYGNYCTFAHGENDLKKKEDNLLQMQMNNMSAMYFNPMMMDINLMQMQNQLLMAGHLEPNNFNNNLQIIKNQQEEILNEKKGV